MGRFAKKYSREQKQALIKAVCDLAMKPQAAVDAAKSGLLPGQGEAFEMPLTTAQALVQQERRRRRGDTKAKMSKAPQAAISEQAAKALAILDSEFDRLGEDAKAGSLNNNEFLANIRAMNELAKYANVMPAQSRPAHKGSNRDDNSPASKTVESLMAAHKRDHAGTVADPKPDAEPEYPQLEPATQAPPRDATLSPTMRERMSARQTEATTGDDDTRALIRAANELAQHIEAPDEQTDQASHEPGAAPK